MKLYHGGVRDLAEGDKLLPPSITGKGTLRQHASAEDVARGHMRSDRVYVTSDRTAAKIYAGAYPNGSLYEVEPVGVVEADPDAPGISWACAEAVVVRVVERRVKFKKKTFERWALRSARM